MLKKVRNVGHWAPVVDFKLPRGAVTGGRFVEFDATAFDGEMKVVGSGTSIAARVGLGAGGNVGHSKWEERIAE